MSDLPKGEVTDTRDGSLFYGLVQFPQKQSEEAWGVDTDSVVVTQEDGGKVILPYKHSRVFLTPPE